VIRRLSIPIGARIDVVALPAAALPDRSVLVTFKQVPVVRYLYEYGPFVGPGEYPRIFRFETGKAWASKEPIDDCAESIRFVVKMPPADVQSRCDGASVSRLGDASGGPLVVGPPVSTLDLGSR